MHAPPLGKLIQLSDIVDVSLDYLVKGLPMVDVPIRSELLHKRFKALETFDQEDQATVNNVIDAIITKRREEHAMRPLAACRT